MEFSKLNAPSLKELFINELEGKILSGQLPVGEQLPSERELAESMQVSRAVVNSGIAELARKGFLTIKPRIGTFVCDYRRKGSMETLISIMNYNGGILRDAEIRSILELRIALDTLAIHLYIPKITTDELTVLQNCIEELQHTSSNAEAALISFSFQHELACLSGNTLLPLIFYSFKVPILTLWERFCMLYGIQTLYENHFQLLDYIKSKDTYGAVDFIKSSIDETIHGSRPIYYR